jgi:hypothetical protein
MALQRTLTSASGIDLPASYHRILSFSGTADVGVDVVVGVYKDFPARQAGLAPVYTEKHTVPYDTQATGTIVGNLYVALRELPEYADATDA